MKPKRKKHISLLQIASKLREANQVIQGIKSSLMQDKFDIQRATLKSEICEIDQQHHLRRILIQSKQLTQPYQSNYISNHLYEAKRKRKTHSTKMIEDHEKHNKKQIKEDHNVISSYKSRCTPAY